MIDGLRELVRGPADTAAKALHLPISAVGAALAANESVLATRTMPALHRYQGVVYDGLALDKLEPGPARFATRCCFVFSGLFGVVRGDESIPDYRVPAKGVLPGIGIVGTAWRPILDEILPTLLGRGLIVDLRSSDYAAMWRPAGILASRTIGVRVLSPLPAGGLGVVSYPSKFAKGQLAAALVTASVGGQKPKTVDDVISVWRQATGLPAQRAGENKIDLYTAG